MPIGSTIGPEGLLEGNRARLYDIILSRPGIRFTDLVAAANLHYGSTLHHLFLLERFQLIRSYRANRSRRYVAAIGSEEETRRAAHLAEEAVRSTLEFVRQNPGTTQREVAARFNLTRQAVGYRLLHLERLGLIVRHRRGRSKTYLAVDQPVSQPLSLPRLAVPA